MEIEEELASAGLLNLSEDLLRRAKEAGFSDKQIAHLCATKIRNIKQLRQQYGIETVFRLVDTCAAEFEAFTPYYYSTYGVESELRPSTKKKIMIIGGGPNRIGQGIEFDYCCVHASFALREAGYETLMINSNPETVSTDYDTSDRLFFEPLTLEDVLEVYKQEKCDGAIVQFGGQTPLNLASELKANGVNIIGTSPESIDAAEDREIFKRILEKLHLKQPVNATATTPEQAYELAGQIGFPILLRPSFVLGGRGKKGIKKIFGGFSQLYGGVNFFSDILSYSRLFGLGLSTAVIGMVVNEICKVIINILTFNGISVLGVIVAIPIFAVGHVFNIAINTLGTYIHDARLQFIEFFGRFFEGGGHVFKPLGSNTKYNYIEK